MSSRNRVIYQSEALFTSKQVDSTGRADHAQLRRVQSANYSFNVTRTDVNQFGQLSRIDSLILEAPTVSADVSYLLTDGFNEEALGFSNSDLNVGFVSGQIESTSGQNLYIVTAAEGKDANFSTGVFGTIGIGNAFVTDYSFEASVGSLPTVTVSFEGSNMNASSNVTGKVTGDDAGFSGNLSGAGIDTVSGIPLDNQTSTTGIFLRPAQDATETGVITALRPGDVTLSLANADDDTIVDIVGNDGAHVQSASLSIPLSRTPIERLGTKFPFARTVDFPITPTLSVSAIVNQTQQRALTDIIDNDAFISSAEIQIKQPGTTNNAAVYKLTNLKLDSESFSSSIGPNKTVDLTFSVSIGGPDDTTNNVFFSGVNTDAKFALSPIEISGNMTAGESATINGITITGTQKFVVGYNHGQTSQVFNVNYTGANDLQFSNTGTTSFSGNRSSGITGLEGVDTTLTITPGAPGTSQTLTGTIAIGN